MPTAAFSVAVAHDSGADRIECAGFSRVVQAKYENRQQRCYVGDEANVPGEFSPEPSLRELIHGLRETT